MKAENVIPEVHLVFADTVADRALDQLGLLVKPVGVIDGAHARRKVLETEVASEINDDDFEDHNSSCQKSTEIIFILKV